MNQAKWCSLGVVLGLTIAAAIGWSPLFKGDPSEAASADDQPKQNSFDTFAQTAPATKTTPRASESPPPRDGKLRIIAFGAHPDDCEIKVGGSGALWAARGHHVRFVSCTNGDIGHWQIAGGPLAQRRLDEVQRAARLLGVSTQVMPIHDGELMPTLENRQAVTRAIRDWKADIVLAHRPNDYHPDHRYTGVLVQDAAYMVAVPFFCPETPHLTGNPVFLYYWDDFKRPNPFRPDVAVSIDDVIERKLDALAGMESQFFEGGATGYTDPYPTDQAGRTARHKKVRDGFSARFAANADKYRDKLIELYGEKIGRAVRYAEAFEVCEYGRQPKPEELRRLFPFFEK
ncbi:MAG: PIG-L family deacetylase [Pirellulales bacterium]